MSTFETLESRRLFAAGDLDPTFGTGGTLNLDRSADMLVPVAGGMVLLVGSEEVSRRDADDLSIDTSFGTAGTTPLPLDAVGDTLVLPDGKILISGRRSSAGDDAVGVLLRFTAGGQADPAFGTAGQVTLPVQDQGATIADDMLLLPDGKILAAGTLNGTGRVYRLNADGSVDSTFTPFGITPQGTNTSLGRQGDGKIIVAGNFLVAGDAISLARLNADGTLDATFGTTGFVRGVETDAVLVLSDDRILAAGTNDDGSAVVTRLTAGGVVDETFGTQGAATVDFGGLGGATQIELDATGRIIVSSPSSIARLTADGAVDESFGRLLSGNAASEFDVLDLLPEPDGDLLVATSRNIVGRPQVHRLQGASGGAAGRIVLTGGAVSVAGVEQGELIELNVGAGGDGNDDVVSISLQDAFGRVYDVADVSHIGVTAAGGNDWVYARVGTQIRTSVSGGDGNDTLIGGGGEESLSGNAGRDVLMGGGGNDRLAGNGGRDKLSAEAGNDRLYGGAGGDWLAGQLGDDTLRGEGGADFLDGGVGNDFVHGDAGDDLIFAAGNDSGIDTVIGDGGTDTAFLDEDDERNGIDVLNPEPQP